MNLKNYTSSVSAHQTISYIEAYLADAGVSGIAKQYNAAKQPEAIVFQIADGDRKYAVKLPANIGAVHDWLWKEYCGSVRQPRKTKDDFAEQAARTAWKIQQDWVQVQISLIKLKQAEAAQVFMAYIWDGEQTVFEKVKGGGMKLLPQAV